MMDEDTLIAMGFVIGAVILVVIIFVWVVVYCLCCRKREEEERTGTLAKPRTQAEQFHYLSSAFNQGESSPPSVSANSSRSDRSYQRDLPQIPKDRVIMRGPPRPMMKTPDEDSRKGEGRANPGFISGMDSMYAYCDDIPRQPAPAVPELRSRPKHRSQSSNELLFLERKYNIKADDTDDVHNSRPLTMCSNTGSVLLQAQTPETDDGADSYADVNNLFRVFSILDPRDDAVSCKKKSSERENHDAPKLNLNHNANLSQREGTGSRPGFDRKEEGSFSYVPPKKATEVILSYDGSMSNTLEQILKLKEVEDMPIDTQNISPASTPMMNSSSVNTVDNLTYFSSIDLADNQVGEATTLPISAKEDSTEQLPATGISAEQKLMVVDSTDSARQPTKPIPTPRHSRSASVTDILMTKTDPDESCGDYTNIPPQPKPRSSLPSTLDR